MRHTRSMRRFAFGLFLLIGLLPRVPAQTSDSGAPAPLPAPSVAEKWNKFETETFVPLTLAAGAFNAGISQATDSTPLYGREFFPGYPARFGSAVGDLISQNFFGDFLLASAFHEDTRYIRRSPSHRFWSRIAYAISRSVVTSSDSGAPTFNWSNVVGTAMSAALSNAYYPDESRTARAASVNWATGVAGSGLANLLPEFLPDFRAWAKRHLKFGH